VPTEAGHDEPAEARCCNEHHGAVTRAAPNLDQDEKHDSEHEKADEHEGEATLSQLTGSSQLGFVRSPSVVRELLASALHPSGFQFRARPVRARKTSSRVGL
jgi:hypothetical protein